MQIATTLEYGDSNFCGLSALGWLSRAAGLVVDDTVDLNAKFRLSSGFFICVLSLTIL